MPYSKQLEYVVKLPEETPAQYVLRLEVTDQRELYIRKNLRTNFNLSLKEAIEVCAILTKAREKEIEHLLAMTKKVGQQRVLYISKNLGISDAESEIWIAKIEAMLNGNNN